jgi:benzoylformate decarboxylase
MPYMSGRSALLALLKQEGIRVMFGNPGTTELALMDAMAGEHEIHYVLGLAEVAVMAMTDGYAQASGGVGFCNLHVAPGLGNALGMLYDAKKAGSPIVVTAGQHPQDFSMKEPLLWAELPEIARPFVKWSAEVRNLADLPQMIHRAVKTALTPPMGPVFLSLPGDIMNAEGEIDLGHPSRVGSAIRGDKDAIARAAALIAHSDNPVLVVGDAIAQSGSFAEIVAFAEALGAPVYDETVASRSNFPSSHRLYRGALTRLGASVHGVMETHDLLVSIGADVFTLSLPSEIEPLPEGMKVVHLDTDPWEIGKNYPVTVGILGDPVATLPELTASVKAQWTKPQAERAAARGTHAAQESAASLAHLRQMADAAADKSPIQALALIRTIGDALPDDAVVIDETISSGAGLRRLLRTNDPQSFYGLKGGGIGWGLAAAVGVKIALPNRPVVALIGDGSAMYTIQALWTAAHEKLNVVYVILNNSSYRILKQRTNALKQLAAQTDTYVGMDLTEPRVDFLSVAKGMGLTAYKAHTLEEVRAYLAKGIGADGPVLIDVEIDRNYTPV